VPIELPPPSEAAKRLKELAEKWAGVEANERAAFQTWFTGFCHALGVPAPEVPTDDYRFELPVKVVDRDGELATNFIDCWHAGHFALEAKMSDAGAKADTLLRKAFGQVRNYVAHVPGTPPPYLMVVDVPRTLMVWDRWSGSYGDFGAGRRVALGSLHERPEEIALLQDVLARPAVRDPRGRAQEVTKGIAARLARLAAALEARGLDQERVARFLMRCVFSCFAEDVGLLPERLFRETLEAARASGDPEELKGALEHLWETMDHGGRFGAKLLHRFNGHFFKTREALPLTTEDVELLIDATTYDWSRVEPSIFGTLLVRALDPEERHRLGAEYTPREYIERLVEPTVVEPIRERWTAVQASVLQLEERGRSRDIDEAEKALLAFHGWMRGLRFLDPACGSGNFLYVTMAAVKRVEQEVFAELARLRGGQGGLVLDEVHPRQFHGIEIKPWAREIAELTLWIGYHQFWRETHGGRTPPDPILEDTGTIECRDAILAYDDVVHRPEKDRPDPTPRVISPVTGELVPDPEARLPYYEYVNARAAEWPEADFIVGNPPYVGNRRMRLALGDGYADALRGAYPEVPESVDLVMYWWSSAAARVARDEVLRVGLITTNSIVQPSNRVVVVKAQERGTDVVWAAPDHPWSGDSDSAAVRVAMTVLARGIPRSIRVDVDDDGRVARTTEARRLNADLSAHADIATAASVPLRSNSDLSFRGFNVVGRGFVITEDEAREFLREKANVEVVRPYLNGRAISRRIQGDWIVDFGLRTEEESRSFARPFQVVLDRVRPARLSDRDPGFREYWWRFGRPRPAMRKAVADLTRYIATSYVAAHRVFVLFESAWAPDDKVVVIAHDSPFVLGVLSSGIHSEWASAAGTRLGVGNDPTYNNPRCFDSFPFPPEAAGGVAIGRAASRIDELRKAALVRDPRITITGIYNVIAKLRAGTALTPRERTIHELAACGILRDLHDELDRLVAEAYGWPWPMEKEEILERLVALHDERVEEEKRGLIRWLRPEYQVPRFAPDSASAAPAELALEEAPATRPKRGRKAKGDGAAAAPAPAPWPTTAVEQIGALGALVSSRPVTIDQALAAFAGAKRELVVRHLDTLVLMGELEVAPSGRFRTANHAG
jgi:hypothetical protein